MSTRFVSIVAAAAGVAAIAGTASAQFWTNGIGVGLLEDISNTGVATGSFGAPNSQYFTWTKADGMQYIGGVAPGNGVGGQAKISNDGRYISGTTFNAAMNYHEMSRYDMMTGSWTGFGAVPGIGQQIDAEVSSGWGMSGDGRHVVGLGWTTLGTADAHAIQWTEGVGITDLGSNAIGQSSRANAANFDGTVVAGWQDGAGRQGAAWVNGVQELIFKEDGVTAAQEAFDVSDNGEWVVGIGIGGFFGPPGQAYRYNTITNTYESLANLAVGAQSRMGAATINGDGSLIGGGTWGVGPATFGNGFIWVEGVGTMTVGEYLTSQGVNYDESYHFSFVSGISEDGKWLAGWGSTTGTGTNSSWIVHVPAPGSAALLGLAGLVATRRRR